MLFQDLHIRKRIGDGHKRSGLFYMDTKFKPMDASVLSAVVSPFRWHCWLGHPSKLKELLPSKSYAFPIFIELKYETKSKFRTLLTGLTF